MFYSFSGCTGCTFESSRASLVSQFFRHAQFAKPLQLFLLIFVTALCSGVGSVHTLLLYMGQLRMGEVKDLVQGRQVSGRIEHLTPSAEVFLCFPVPLHEHSWRSNILSTWIECPTGVCEKYTGAPSEDSSGCRSYPRLWTPPNRWMYGMFLSPHCIPSQLSGTLSPTLVPTFPFTAVGGTPRPF